MTLFERISAGEIPARLVHETEEFIAFHDTNPQAPVHILIVPRRCISRVAEATVEDAALIGRMLVAAGKIAEKLGVLTSGFRLVINNGQDAGETIPHLHIHLLGGRSLNWPPG